VTRFEQIARAYPLHAQRIAELSSQAGRLEWLREPAWLHRDGRDALVGAFVWGFTPEGYDYWEALANGDGLR
jgi:hypothetical protein